jgi:hypothetical protein
MIGDIRKHLITPFVPFSVRLPDGREYPVPTIDQYLPAADGRSGGYFRRSRDCSGSAWPADQRSGVRVGFAEWR